MDYRINRQLPPIIKKTIQANNPNISVVVKPTNMKIVDLRTLNRPKVTLNNKQQVRQQPPPSIPQKLKINSSNVNIQSAVSRQQVIQKKKSSGTKVRYISTDITPESIGRIAKLKNIGKGRLLLIVGNGPSISEIDLAQLKNKPKLDTLSVNKPDSRLWPTTYWAFFDYSQFRRNEDLWNSYNGLIFNSVSIKRQKQQSMQFKNVQGLGWSMDLTSDIHIGRSSVYAAMQIGLWMNYDHIYIVGVDMNPEGINGKLHFYGNNPDITNETRIKGFAKEAEYYDNAASLLTEEQRARFIFCSGYNPWPFVKKYDSMSHLIVVKSILEHLDHLG